MKTVRIAAAALTVLALIGGTAVSAQAASAQPTRKTVIVFEKER